MRSGPPPSDDRFQQLSDAVWRTLQGDLEVRLDPSGAGDALDALTEGIGVLLAKFQSQYRQQKQASERLAELTDMMVALAARDFESMVSLRRDGGPFDTVAIGLKMLAEELQGSTVSNDYVFGIINSMADVLFVTDAEGSVRTVNPAACRLVGLSEDDLVGKGFESLLAADSEKPSFSTFLAGDGTDGVDATFATPNGPAPLELSCSLVRGLDDQVQSVIIVGRDMRETRRLLAAEAASAAEKAKADELKRAYDELRETQFMLIQTAKLTALGELAASVAHELNQPLNNIKLIMQAIRRDLRHKRYDLETLEEDTVEVIDIVGKMAGIINHMRTFARKPDEKLRVAIDVNATLLNAMRMLREQLRLNSVEVEEELAADLPEISGDPNNLEQVMLNLLTNARDAVFSRVESQSGYQGKIWLRTGRLGGNQIYVEVRDNGDGISEEACSRLFEPFFTTKEPGKGTGLGLAIAQRVAAEYGGTIEVNSTRGEGATFRVLLPLQPSP